MFTNDVFAANLRLRALDPSSLNKKQREKGKKGYKHTRMYGRGNYTLIADSIGRL